MHAVLDTMPPEAREAAQPWVEGLEPLQVLNLGQQLYAVVSRQPARQDPAVMRYCVAVVFPIGPRWVVSCDVDNGSPEDAFAAIAKRCAVNG